MAERVGFEPTVAYATLDFESSAALLMGRPIRKKNVFSMGFDSSFPMELSIKPIFDRTFTEHLAHEFPRDHPGLILQIIRTQGEERLAGFFRPRLVIVGVHHINRRPHLLGHLRQAPHHRIAI